MEEAGSAGRVNVGKILCLTVLLGSILFAANIVEAERWLKIADDELGIFIDTESITFASPTIVRVWSKFVGKGLRNPQWEGVSYAETYNEVDCKYKESRFIQGTIYYKDGREDPQGGFDLEYLHPGIETVHEFICNDFIKLQKNSTESSERAG